MRLLILAGAVCLLSACTSGVKGTNNPAGPSPTAGPPAVIQVAITRGLGATADRGFITGTVFDAAGIHVDAGVAVTLSTSAGAIDVTPVATNTAGQFTGAVTSSNAATITAKAGSAAVAASLPLSSNLPATLTVSVGSIAATTGVPTTLAATAPSGAQISSYRWTFGDEALPVIPTDGGASIAHTYAAAGVYAASVVVADAIGRTATGGGTITVTNAPAPPVIVPPPAPTLVITLNCTAQAHGTPTPCNVSATYAGAALASNVITSVSWDWGDGPPIVVVPNSPLSSHNYLQAGVYPVSASVTATTIDGAKTASASKTLTVN